MVRRLQSLNQGAFQWLIGSVKIGLSNRVNAFAHRVSTSSARPRRLRGGGVGCCRKVGRLGVAEKRNADLTDDMAEEGMGDGEESQEPRLGPTDPEVTGGDSGGEVLDASGQVMDTGSEDGVSEDAETIPEEYRQVPKVPIPVELYSEETGLPFTHSLVRGDLLDGDTPYYVQKVYCRGEVIREMALTIPEMMEVNDGMSEHSRQRLETVITERLDLEARYERLLGEGTPPSFDHWTGRCAFFGHAREDCEEYSVSAFCLGGHLLFLPNSPMMCSGAFDELIQSILSPETRRLFDDFVDDNFPSPPKLEDLPWRPLAFV